MVVTVQRPSNCDCAMLVVLIGIKGAARKRLSSRRFMARFPFEFRHGQRGDAAVVTAIPQPLAGFRRLRRRSLDD
jgi:hypothetical protein